MIIQMTDDRGEQVIMEVESYQMKYYEPGNCLQKLSYKLIRPPRLLYNEDLLKPQSRLARRFQHTVFHIPFPLSLYQPSKMDYVILYLHGNASNRLEGFQQLSRLPDRVGLACFDFDGCGNRLQRQFISLGKEEAAQVNVAVSFLKGKGHRVVGWGRSMGSVSLLLSSECQVVVADSPFFSLKTLCYEQSISQVPCFCRPCLCCLFPCLIGCVGIDISNKTKTTFDDLEIIDHINSKKERSILFLAGTADTLISYQHAVKLHDRFQGRKKLMLFDGDHNSDRSIEVLVSVYFWIQEELAELEGHTDGQSKKLTSSPMQEANNAKSLSQMALIGEYQCQLTVNNSESHERVGQERTAAESIAEQMEGQEQKVESC